MASSTAHSKGRALGVVGSTRAVPPSDLRALGVVAIIGFGLVFVVALPVGAGLFLGALLAFSLEPLCQVLVKRTKRPLLATIGCTAASSVVICGGLAFLVYLFADRGAAFAKDLPGALSANGPLTKLSDQVGRRLHPIGLDSNEIMNRLHGAADRIGVHAAELTGAAAAAVIHVLVAMAFMTLTTYFVLRNSDRVSKGLESLIPLEPRHTRKLIDETRVVGRHVMLGTVVVGLIQGVLAGIGYAITRAPHPVFFGAMTAAASALPGLGTMFVWVTVGGYLLATGHAAAGIVLFVWGALIVVLLCDVILRPTLVGRDSTMGLLPTLVGLFGGLEIFGFIGLLLGPTMVGLGLAAMRLYAAERRRVMEKA
jgi:predicted PurR-regulated permease PerM